MKEKLGVGKRSCFVDSLNQMDYIVGESSCYSNKPFKYNGLQQKEELNS
jgi:hypothetical protein